MIKYSVEMEGNKAIDCDGLRLARETANFWASQKKCCTASIVHSGVTIETYRYSQKGDSTYWKMNLIRRPSGPLGVKEGSDG